MLRIVNRTKITLVDVYSARKRIHGRTVKTPLVRSSSLSSAAGADVRLKLEHHQITGSFKLRGASNAILNLDEALRRKGVTGMSTGNFGRGLAHSSKHAGIRCVICMSNLVPENKVEAIRALGAEVRIVGRSQDDAQLEVDGLVAAEGLVALDPFDHPDVIAGQGTLGLEIMDAWPAVELVVVPLSGGGLVGGVALAVKSISPGVRVLGVTMERGAAMYESIRAGKPVPVEEHPSLADSLGGGIGLNNQYTFDLVRDLVDDIVLVSEEEIAEGIRHAYWQEKQVIEGGAAVGVAALLAGKITPARHTCVVLSGCNIDMPLHHRVIGGENPAL
jgi:threonine dehydratase